jgi:hypothetical protein
MAGDAATARPHRSRLHGLNSRPGSWLRGPGSRPVYQGVRQSGLLCSFAPNPTSIEMYGGDGVQILCPARQQLRNKGSTRSLNIRVRRGGRLLRGRRLRRYKTGSQAFGVDGRWSASGHGLSPRRSRRRGRCTPKAADFAAPPKSAALGKHPTRSKAHSLSLKPKQLRPNTPLISAVRSKRR